VTRTRPDAATALLHGLGERLGSATYQVESLSCRDWASATFSGTRHKLTLLIGADHVAAFLDGIEEAEFGLRGHILADIAVAGSEQDGDSVRVALEALTVVED
jgi:hypothetical protein